MMLSVDPVFAALGLDFSGQSDPSLAAVNGHGDSRGYAQQPWASPSWAANVGVGSVATAAPVMTSTLPPYQPPGQFGAPAVVFGGNLQQTFPPPAPVEGPASASEVLRLPATPRDPASPAPQGSPLVLPDVLEAVSSSGDSACDSQANLFVADASLDAALWPSVATAAPVWPWPSPSAAGFPPGILAVVAAANMHQRHLEGSLLSPCGTSDFSPSSWPSVPEETWLSGNSPCPSLLSPGSGGGGGTEKENVPRNLSLVFQQQRPLLSDMLATPPPKSSGGCSMRVEAPCFVPGGVPGDAPAPYSGQTPEKVSLGDGGFVSARAHMLSLRPKDSPKRQLSAAALYAASASFVTGRAPTPPPPPLSQLAESLEGKRGGVESKSRAQIRAIAANARAEMAQAASTTWSSEKDATPNTPPSLGNRRNRGRTQRK